MSEAIHFNCRSCKAPLADIEVTQPDENTKWEVRATCDHCGDSSYVKKFAGAFSFINEPATLEYSVVDEIDMDVSPMLFKTKKVKQYA